MSPGLGLGGGKSTGAAGSGGGASEQLNWASDAIKRAAENRILGVMVTHL